jgi:hypothetical protein
MDSVEDVVERMKRINKNEIKESLSMRWTPIPEILYRSYCIAHE